MPNLNWRRYQSDFDSLAEELHNGRVLNHAGLLCTLQGICRNDRAYHHLHVGVPSYLVAFLEFLFFRAEGPYSPGFTKYACIITVLFASSEELRSLIDRNAADALGNMVLNRRGRLKFTIADRLELDLILQWWSRFGLSPVTRREIFETILHKTTVPRRIAEQDPGLIIRLSEVFPEYLDEFWPYDLSREELEMRLGSSAPPPSHRRYRQIYEQMMSQESRLEHIIVQEELRILPIQVKRNSFLAFLVKQLHEETCQICRAGLAAPYATPVTVHHIIPLSQGGDDTASNMIVVCSLHHQAIHRGTIVVRMGELMEIRSQEGLFFVQPNRIMDQSRTNE